MSDALRALVAAQAGNRCEYCRLSEADDVYTFHVEHIIALKHGGSGELANRAFACQNCNLHKGPNLSGIDSATGGLVPLFHPRRDRWEEHFTMRDFRFVGRTPTGRATIQVLCMNDKDRVRLRRMITGEGISN